MGPLKGLVDPGSPVWEARVKEIMSEKLPCGRYYGMAETAPVADPPPLLVTVTLAGWVFTLVKVIR